jgi:hypothetical protein
VHRWLARAAIAATGVIAMTVYVRQPAPRSPIADAVGVRRSRPFHPFCGWFVRDTRLGTWPTGRVVCAWLRPGTPDRRPPLDQMSYSVLTRRVSYAARSWEPLSDECWRRDVDSVRTALRAQGGVPSCEIWSRRSRDDSKEYWRFRNFEISLLTGRGTGLSMDGDTRVPRWFLILEGRPGRMPGCDGVPDPSASFGAPEG